MNESYVQIDMKECIRCGRIHGTDAHSIAKDCPAVKAVRYVGYVYGDNGSTVSWPGIDCIEYVDIEQQRMLRFENVNSSNEGNKKNEG